MTTVLVHGVPETSRVWDGVRAYLDGDHVALALPGFGCPRPPSFAATMDDYAAWLLGELDRIRAPIDLVGHDWGGILTARIATAAGERIRTWVSDAVTFLDPNFVWHDFAKIWQTPAEGEKFWSDMRETPSEQTAALLSSLGVPAEGALSMVEAGDETMAECILSLYRSAVNISTDWAHDGTASRPGLVLVGSGDIFANEAQSREIAKDLGAEFATLPGLGHWWLLQDPAAGAAALKAFWSTASR